MTGIGQEQLIAVGRAAGEVALGHFRRAGAQRKTDRSLVTEADRDVERFLVAELGRLMPSAGIVGEEGSRRPTRDGMRIVIDPIDGTAAFVAGLPTWCICIGIMHHAAPVAGVVHLPVTGETYVAADGGAWWNEIRLPDLAAAVSDGGDLFALAHAKAHVRHQLRYQGKVRSLGSTAYHMVLVARGVAEAALIGHVRIWDLAAPLAILHAVGGDLCTLGGALVPLDGMLDGERAPDYLVAAARAELPRLLPLLGGA